MRFLASSIVWILGALCVLGLGCASPIPLGSFTVMSPVGYSHSVRVLDRGVEGRHCTHDSIFTALFTRPEDNVVNYELATDRAITSIRDGDVLVDAELFYEVIIAIVWNRYCAIAVGDVGAFE